MSRQCIAELIDSQENCWLVICIIIDTNLYAPLLSVINDHHLALTIKV